MTPGLKELDDAFMQDMHVELKTTIEQIHNGPFYPEKGITKESLMAWAEKCRKIIERYKDGGGHKAAVSGEAFRLQHH